MLCLFYFSKASNVIYTIAKSVFGLGLLKVFHILSALKQQDLGFWTAYNLPIQGVSSL